MGIWEEMQFGGDTEASVGPVGVRAPGDVQREAEYQDIVGQRREAGAEMEETAHGCG